MKVYLAGPIFTYGDYLRNTEWADKIRKAFPGIDLYSPVENTDINGVEGKKKFAGSKEIAAADNARLNNTDILIACIDGDVLPAGTCAEIGKFHEKIARGENKLIIGICTDNRQCFYTHSQAKDEGGAASLGEQQYSYQNLYVTGLIKEVGQLVYTIEEVIAIMQLWEKQNKNYLDAKLHIIDRHCRGLANGTTDPLSNPQYREAYEKALHEIHLTKDQERDLYRQLNKAMLEWNTDAQKEAVTINNNQTMTYTSPKGETTLNFDEILDQSLDLLKLKIHEWGEEKENEIGGDHIND